MKYFSLFSGIGGFEKGIQQAYVDSINRSTKRKKQKDSAKNDEEGTRLVSAPRQDTRTEKRQSSEYFKYGNDSRKPHCVGYSEIDKYAIQIYQKHFPEHKNYGNIKAIETTKLPDFELLVGGFPCQSFSIAGKRRGFEDTRGTLFFEIARILKAKKPRALLLENVKGLLSHDNGNTFKTIIATLTELGYDLQWQVLNSKNFGVPQNRERVFIIGHLRGTARPKVFPFTDDGRQTNELPRHVSNTFTRRYEGAQAVGTYIGESKLHAQEVIAIDTKNVGAPRFTKNVATLGANDYKEPKQVMIGTKIRRLTPLECERLQGFPDYWTDCVSDTQRYKCLGNAVTVNVIQAIVKKIFDV